MNWRSISLMVLCSMVLTFVYIFLLKWLSSVIIWSSVLGTISGLGFGVYYAFIQYEFYKNNPAEREPDVTNLKALLQSYLIKSVSCLLE